MVKIAFVSLVAVLGVLIWSAMSSEQAVQADEGMWLLNNPPRDLLKRKYSFDLENAWLERVQKASVRFNNGGSGSFVSPDGLVVTNHHIGAECLEKLSPKDKDYYRDGYYGARRDQELKCPDLELNVAAVDRGCDRAGQRGHQPGHDARSSRRCATRRHGRDRKGIARPAPACVVM